jgi:hypothetical protein
MITKTSHAATVMNTALRNALDSGGGVAKFYALNGQLLVTVPLNTGTIDSSGKLVITSSSAGTAINTGVAATVNLCDGSGTVFVTGDVKGGYSPEDDYFVVESAEIEAGYTIKIDYLNFI